MPSTRKGLGTKLAKWCAWIRKINLIFNSKMEVAVNKDIKIDEKRIHVHTYYNLRLQSGSQHILAAPSGSRIAVPTQNSAKQIAFILFYFWSDVGPWDVPKIQLQNDQCGDKSNTWHVKSGCSN